MRTRTAGRPRQHRPRAALVALLAGLVALAGLGPASAAGGSASVSDTNPAPGQVVTVSATGLKPGGPSLIDYLPDGVRLAEVTVGPDGSYQQDVRIPDLTLDGPKQIVVTALDAAGRYTYLPIDIRVSGPQTTARLSDTTLTPNQAVRLSGERFMPGRQVLIVLFPEGVDMGSAVADSSGRVVADLRMPAQLLNGRHVFAVAGAKAGGGHAPGGGFAYLKLEATVTGGVGFVPTGTVVPADLEDFFRTSTTLPTSSTSSTSTTTTIERDALADDVAGSDGASTGLLLVLLLLCLALVAGTVLMWLRSDDGYRWLRKRLGRAR